VSAYECVSPDDDTASVRKGFDNSHDSIAMRRNYSSTSTRVEWHGFLSEYRWPRPLNALNATRVYNHGVIM